MGKQVKRLHTVVQREENIDSKIAKEVMNLRTKGMQISDIAAKFQFTEVELSNIINNALSRAADAMADNDKTELLALELMRLDQLQSGLWDQAQSGDRQSTETILKIINQRTELLKLASDNAGTTHQTVVVQGDSASYIRALNRANEGAIDG